MKILIPTKNNKIITGPERWKTSLIGELEKTKDIKVFPHTGAKPLFTVFSCDTVHIYYASTTNFLILLLCKLLNKKCIFTIHGDYYQESKQKLGFRKILWLPLHILCSKLASFVTFPSQYLNQKILLHQPKLASKSCVIYNGVDIKKIQKVRKKTKNELNLDSNDLLFITVTNLNLKQKAEGLKLLFTSFNKYLLINPNTYLFVIGSGKFLKKYKQEFQNDHIRFLGYKKDAIAFIKACDLFVYFSFLDNLPYVILEALACNKPIQSLATGGIPEILSNKYITKGEINMLEHNRYNLTTDISAQRMAHDFSKLYQN